MGKKLPDCFKDYEAGKARRYGLLFSVNGGAFAIAKLFAEPRTATLLGGLNLKHLAIGMVLFTIAMTWDIWKFGEAMRSTLPDDALRDDGDTLPVFGRPGRNVLIAIGSLIAAGWTLVAAD